MVRDLYGKVVKVLLDDDTMARKKVLKGYDDIDRNVHFVSPVIQTDDGTYEITSKPNRKGYHEIIKRFTGDRVDSRF